MGIFQALTIGVAGLHTQSNVIGVISDNIANVNTVGYKRKLANFQTLIQNPSNPATYSPAGANNQYRNVNGRQGEFVRTNTGTDIAISGNGFFVVSPNSPASGEFVYTRAGSFRANANGDLVNGAGFFLQGWPLDSTGALADALGGGVDAGTAHPALTTVNVQNIVGSVIATSNISIRANLTASQAVYDGTTLPYNAADPAANMAEGAIPSHYNRSVTIVDSSGEQHELMLGFLKTGINTWSVEIYASPASEAAGTNPQFASGTLTFNGDGSLAAVGGDIAGFSAAWAGGGTNSIVFNWGTAGEIFGTPGATTIGLTDGMSQLDDDYQVDELIQDGSVPGLLDRVEIDANGTLTAIYDNGAVRRLYRIPLGVFRDPNLLENVTGNIFRPTELASDVQYVLSGQVNGGVIESGVLESANVDLETQLTTMIIAQRAYQSNTKTISTSDEMMDTLIRMAP